MSTRANFAFLREGTSDDGLIPHLGELLIRSGLHEALGTPRDYKGRVTDCLMQVLGEEATIDVIFVHRDSDGPSDTERRGEIASAIEELGTDLTVPVVPVMPIQE